MSSDYQLEDTVFLPFTTRAFATGIPTVLAGSPAIDIYEDATATPIITGETLVVSLNSVVGFNMITVTATAGTGFGAGQSYTAILQAGTVGGVSVVGEVVAHFTLDMSSAAKDLANGTDGLGAIKAETALIVADTNELQTDNVPGLIATAQADLDIITGADGVNLLSGTQTSIDAIETDTGTTLQAELDAIQAAVITNATGVDIAADIIALKAETVLIVADTNELQTDDIPGTLAGLNDIAAADVWAVDATGQQTQGTFGQAIGDPGATAKSLWQAAISDAAGVSVSADVIAVKAETANILTDTAEIGAAGAGLSALPWNAAWDAEVESEVNDALDTAIAELGVAAPTATPTIRTGLMLMYMALRNKLVVQTSGTDALEIYNNAGTKIAAKLLTDDGSDYTEAEMS